MPRRRVGRHKILCPRVVAQPGRAARQRSHQCRLRHRLDGGRAALRCGVDRNNQTASLVVPPRLSQDGLGSVNDAMQLARFDLDRRAVLCRLKRHAQELQQSADAVFVAVAVLALETAHREQVGRLEVGCAAVDLVGVLMHPRTSNVVFAAAQRLFIKPAFFQRSDNLVLVGARDVNAVLDIAHSGFAARCFLARFNRRCQFQALDNLVDGVAAVGVELDQLALERRVGLAIAGERQAAPAGRRGLRAGVAHASFDHALIQRFDAAQVGLRLVEQVRRLIVAGAGFDHDGWRARGQTLQRQSLCANVIQHHAKDACAVLFLSVVAVLRCIRGERVIPVLARVLRAGLAELPRIAAPCFALFWLPVETQNERAMRLGQASENCLQELFVICRGGGHSLTSTSPTIASSSCASAISPRGPITALARVPSTSFTISMHMRAASMRIWPRPSGCRYKVATITSPPSDGRMPSAKQSQRNGGTGPTAPR